MPHKLSHTLQKISKLDPLKPILYCARTTYISSDAKRILGYSDRFLKRPSFQNAIVQSIAGGNTMAFNNPLKKIMKQFKEVSIVSHDWWLYIVNELSGGKTLYDPESTILYRQHNKSLIGANTGFMAKLRRLRMLFRGTYRNYNSIHLKALQQLNISASKRNIRIIDDFFNLRDKGLRQRVGMIKTLGLYRQTLGGHLALYLGAILHKL